MRQKGSERRRFVFKNIEARAADFSRIEAREQGHFVNRAAASGHHARRHASTPRLFLPAMRRMVIAYLVASTLFVASIAVLPWL